MMRGLETVERTNGERSATQTGGKQECVEV